MTSFNRGLGLALALALAPLVGRAEPSIDVIEKMMVQDRPHGLPEIRERLWSTPIGLLLNEYLFEDDRPGDATHTSHVITRRAYSSPEMILPRLSALSILTKDLFERGLVDSRTNIRISQLQNDLGIMGGVAKENTTKKIMALFPNMAMISLAASSNVVREQGALIAKRLLKKANPFARATAEPGPGLYDPLTRRLVHDRFLDEIDYVYGMNFFLSSYATAAVYYNMFEDGAREGDGVSARAWNLILQSHTRLESL